MELTVDLSATNIRDLELRRTNGHSEIEFSVEGTVEDVDEETVLEAFQAQSLQPVEITFETDND